MVGKTVIDNPTNEDVYKISQNLASNSEDYFLAMSEGRIDDTGIRRLSEALLTNTNLKLLDLAKNQITDVGVKYLADVLTKNTTLLFLSISGNMGITNEGCEHLSEMLKKNTTLKVLDFSHNRITNIDPVLAALEVNKTVEMVKMRYINVKDVDELEDRYEERIRLRPLNMKTLWTEVFEENKILNGLIWPQDDIVYTSDY